ncbi:ABC transporter [Ordospora pajunii]|uniref:ABC transporter n=1 Tax=Ordospora pajunii TaxID=3039483 RepID=UPI00295270CB|nr:ABC transporter [Ordospora pajunii]KAH9410946.1 ABC transporter [Ordospora pajunii]
MEEQIALKFEDVFLKVPCRSLDANKEYIELVSGISGQICSGKLTAIMGGSGSGKTTFMKLLLGKVSSNALTSGIISLNGKQRSAYEWLKSVSYMEQFDTFSAYLSVEESIRYSFIFRGKAKPKDFSISKAVDEIISEMGLRKIRKSLVMTISGGERRRLMLAMDLAAEPDIIFLDEPTSGLDSQLALEIVQILKKYAESKNKIILMTVHQPGNMMLGMFDDIIFLNKGKMMYMGPTSGLQGFLELNQIHKPDDLSIAECLFAIETDSFVSEQYGMELHTSNRKEMEKSNEYCIVTLFSWKHVWHLLNRQVKIDYRNGMISNILLFKLTILTFLFLFLCCKVKYSVFMFISKMFPVYSENSKGYIDDLKIFLRKLYPRLDVMYADVTDFLSYNLIPFITSFSIFNDSSFLDNEALLKKEMFRCDYSQFSLLVSILIYECGFSLLRSLFFCMLIGFTQFRDILTSRTVLMLTTMPLSMVIFMIAAKSFSCKTYPLNITRVAAFVLTTFLRPYSLSIELEELYEKYVFMKYLYPLSYSLFLCPFLFIDTLFYATLGETKSISPGFRILLSHFNNIVLCSGGSAKSAMNRSITFLNRSYLSNSSLAVLIVFSLLLTLVLSMAFLMFKFSPRVRLILSNTSLAMDLKEVTTS